MERLGKRITACLCAISLLAVTVFGADLINMRIGINSTTGSTRASNIVGFDTDLAKENPQYLFRFSVTNLADDQDIADYFYSGKTDPVKYSYGTKAWHKALSNYLKDHIVTGAGDGYWLGDHDTVDFRGHIIHAINTNEETNPYGKALKEALTNAVNSSTEVFTKSTTKPLYAFADSTNLKHLVLDYNTSRLMYDYVKYQYEHKADNFSRDPYTYTMLKTLQQNIDDDDVDNPIVMVIEVQLPVLGDGEHSVTSCDNEEIYDPTYSYWATVADMTVRCGGSIETIRNSSSSLKDASLFPTDTTTYSKVISNHFGASSLTDRFVAKLTGSYTAVPDSSYSTTKTCKIYGNVWPNRWTEMFFKTSYTEWGVRLRTKGLYLGHLIYDGKINRDNTAFTENLQVNYKDTIDSYTVATMFADYNGDTTKRDSELYASIDRSIYPYKNSQTSDSLMESGVNLYLYYPSKSDLISTVQDNLALGVDSYTINSGQTKSHTYTTDEFLTKLYNYSTYASDYKVNGESSGANISLTTPMLTLHDATSSGVHFDILSNDAQRSGIVYNTTNDQPATAVIGHLKGNTDSKSTGTLSDEATQINNVNNTIQTFKTNPMKLAELLDYTEPLTTSKDLTLISGAQLFKVRLKFAYHVDNYQHKIYLHNIQFDNPSYLTINYFDASTGKSPVAPNQIVKSYAASNPDGNLYTSKEEAEKAVRNELKEINDAYQKDINSLGGLDPYGIKYNPTVVDTRLNIYSNLNRSKTVAKSALTPYATARLGETTTLASGELGTLNPTEGYSGYKLFITATQYHGDVRETVQKEKTYYVVDHPVINITEGFQGTTDGTGKLMTDYVARTRNQSIGDSSFCTTMRYNNIAYIEILDASVEVLNSIDGYGVLDNLALTDTKVNGTSEQYTQLTSDKKLVLTKAMNAFNFKYFVAAYNTDNYTKDSSKRTSLNKDKPNGYYLTKDKGHSSSNDRDTRESNIDNSLLLNWDEKIHSKLKDAGKIEIPDGYNSSNYYDEPYTSENLRNMMYTTNLQRTGRLINSFLYPTKDSMAQKTFSDIDATADFSGMYLTAMKALVRDQCYVEENSDDIHLYWDPTKFGGTDYGTLPIASALFTSIYFYRQCNYVYVLDDALELKYDGNIFSLCGAKPFDSSEINAILDNSVVTQLLLNKYYTSTAYNMLKEFTTGQDFKSAVWHRSEETSNLKTINKSDGWVRTAVLKSKNAGTSIAWVANCNFSCQRYAYWVRRMAGHSMRYCRYNNTTENKLDLMNDTVVRIGDAKDYRTYNDIRGYKALTTSDYIYDNPEALKEDPSVHMYGSPYVGYNAGNASVNTMPTLTSEIPVFSLHGQYPYQSLKESLLDSKLAEHQRSLISQLLNKSNISFKVTDNPQLGVDQTEDIAISELNKKYEGVENKGIYVDIDVPYTNLNTDAFEYISPVKNIVNIGGYDTGLTVGSLNILRSNLNGTLNTGTVCATYKNLLNDSRKYDFYVGDSTAQSAKEIVYSPKLLSLDKQLRAKDASLSMFNTSSIISSRDVGHTYINKSLDSQTQASVETANVTIDTNAEIHAKTSKLSKYIGISDAEAEASSVDVDKTYAVRDQRVATDLHTLDGTQYDEKLVTSTANSSGPHSQKSVTNAYNSTITSSLKNMKRAELNNAFPTLNYQNTPQTSGTLTIPESGELRYVTASGTGVAFGVEKGEEYLYSPTGIARKHDVRKDISIGDVVNSTGSYLSDYENANVVQTGSIVSMTPLSKDTDGIHIKLGAIYDTKNSSPRLTTITEAKYVSVVPNFKFIDTEYNSDTIAYHGVQLDREQQYQSFSFHLNNAGFAWKPETKDFSVIASDDSNRVIGTVNNNNNFIWKDLQSVKIKHILNVKFTEDTFSLNPSDSNYYMNQYSKFIPNFNSEPANVRAAKYFPYPQIAYESGTVGQLADGAQFYYQKDMKSYDALSGKEIDSIPALNPNEYNLYRLEFKYNGKDVCCYIEQGLLVTSMTHTSNTKKLLKAYNDFTNEYVGSSLVAGRKFNENPLNYLYDEDVVASSGVGVSFRRSVVFGDLPVPYVTGTDYDNDITNVEYNDTTGKPVEEQEYYASNKISGIPMRAGDFFKITFAIDNYILSEHGAEPIKYSFLEDSDSDYVIDNTKDWVNRKNLDKSNATIEIVYDSTTSKDKTSFSRTTVFRMLKSANIQPSIRIPNSAHVNMNYDSGVFSTFDTTILAEGTNQTITDIAWIIDPLLYNPETYGNSSVANSAYAAYPTGANLAADFSSLKASVPYTIYNECIADVFILGSEEENMLTTARYFFGPYGKVQKNVFDSTEQHLMNTQDILTGTRTLHGAVIHSMRDSIWNSPNARFITKATNPKAYRFANDNYKKEYLLRNVRMTALGSSGVKTYSGRPVHYPNNFNSMENVYVFKVLNELYVSPNLSDWLNNNVTLSYSGSPTIKRIPDLIWLYYDEATAPTSMGVSDYLAATRVHDGHYLDFGNNGKYRYCFEIAKNDNEVYDVDITNYNTALASKYNSQLLSSTTTTNYTALTTPEVVQPANDAGMFSLDDEFTVTVDFKDLNNIKRLKYAYITFPFPVYVRKDMADTSIQESDEKLILYKANTKIPLGSYYQNGIALNSTTYNPSGGILDLGTLSLDGMTCNTAAVSTTNNTSSTSRIENINYLTDETCHFVPYQYTGDDKFEYTYHFWIPLSAGEWSNAQYELHAVPYNCPSIAIPEFGTKTSYISNSHYRNTLGYKNSVDVVGRIGSFTLNDLADFRWSDTFKQNDPSDKWYAYGLIHKVTTEPKTIITEAYDIRGRKADVDENNVITSTTMNNYGTQTLRESTDVTKMKTPLQTGYNIHPGLNRSFPLNGYAQYYSIETTGAYYGQVQQPIDIIDNMKTGVNAVNSNNEFGQEKVQVVPVYYDIAIDDRGRYRIYPLDVYQHARNGSYVMINRNLYYDRLYGSKYVKVLNLIDSNSYYIYETNNTSSLSHKEPYDSSMVSKYISDNLKRKNVMMKEAFTTKRVTTYMNNFLNMVAVQLKLIVGKNNQIENTHVRTNPILGSDLTSLVAGSSRLYQMMSAIDAFGSVQGSTSNLLGERYIQGNAQASFLRERARTFIGGPSNALSTDEMDDVFEQDANIDIQTQMNAQKYYYTHQLPSDAKFVYSDYVPAVGDKEEDVFLPNEETLTYKDGTTVNIKHYILTRFNIIANGAVWSLRYNVPNNGKDTVYILDRAKTDKENNDTGFDVNKLPIYVDIDNKDNYFNNGSIRFFSGDKERATLYDPPSSGFGSVPSNVAEENDVANNLYKDPSGSTINRDNISTTDLPSTTETLEEKTDPTAHTNTTRDWQGKKSDNSPSHNPSTYTSHSDKGKDPATGKETDSSNGPSKDPSAVTPDRKDPPTSDGILSQDPPGAPALPNNSNLDDLSTLGTH